MSFGFKLLILVGISLWASTSFENWMGSHAAGMFMFMILMFVAFLTKMIVEGWKT